MFNVRGSKPPTGSSPMWPEIFKEGDCGKCSSALRCNLLQTLPTVGTSLAFIKWMSRWRSWQGEDLAKAEINFKREDNLSGN